VTPEARIVFAAAAIEALFGREDARGQQWLASCSSWLLPRQRRWPASQDVRSTYRVRNAIVHKGMQLTRNEDLDSRLDLLAELIAAATDLVKAHDPECARGADREDLLDDVMRRRHLGLGDDYTHGVAPEAARPAARAR
jgi:hypothetical protein